MDTKKALNIAAGMCSNKECCAYDIREKLIKWEIPEKEIIGILEFLYKNNFLDDTRFTNSYARDKFRFNKWGKQKIFQKLRQKGLPENMINQALERLGKEDYCETCFTLLKKKIKTLKEEDPYKKKIKLTRFAVSRGFDFDTINKCITRLTGESGISDVWDE